MAKPVVFVSHITEEAKLAALIKERIETAFLGMIEVFVSSDVKSIQPGARWLSTISDNLQAAEVMLVLCSKTSVRRPWINFEAGAAWVKEIHTVPVCHTDLARNQLPAPLSQLQAIDASEEAHWAGVFQVLADKLRAKVPPVDLAQLAADIRAVEESYRQATEVTGGVLVAQRDIEEYKAQTDSEIAKLQLVVDRADGTPVVGAVASSTLPSQQDLILASLVRDRLMSQMHVEQLDITAESGVIYLRGSVLNQQQVTEIARRARSVEGVTTVINLLRPSQTAR
jgi:hypothetical protein